MIPYAWIGGGIAVITAGAILYHGVTVSSLKASIGDLEVKIEKESDRLDSCKTSVIAESLNYSKCMNNLTVQNLAKTKVDAELAATRADYDKLKANPEVIYKDVIKWLPPEYKDEDCKTILNSLDGLNLNSL
jgi:hypothetical protein